MEQARLIDGSPPASPDDVFRRLDELGVEVQTHRHPPVFTVEESRALRGSISGAHLKNLFLRNKKGRMWLLVTPENRALDLKEVGALIGSGRLSFASSDRLMSYLGVIPGAVTPLAVINDKSHAVQVAIDSELLAYEALNVHPLDNSMTTSIAPEGLLQFLEAEGHAPQIVSFDTPG
jgi:Ala-tRNA(Pro) deacylase